MSKDGANQRSKNFVVNYYCFVFAVYVKKKK